MVAYKVVKEKTINRLELAVTKLIMDGWHPQGGICLGFGSLYKTTPFEQDFMFDDVFYLQAMLKGEL